MHSVHCTLSVSRTIRYAGFNRGKSAARSPSWFDVPLSWSSSDRCQEPNISDQSPLLQSTRNQSWESLILCWTLRACIFLRFPSLDQIFALYLLVGVPVLMKLLHSWMSRSDISLSTAFRSLLESYIGSHLVKNVIKQNLAIDTSSFVIRSFFYL